MRCFTCNEVGHMSYSCPNSQRETVNLVRLSDEQHHEELVRVFSTPLKYSEQPATASLDGAYFEATLNGKKALAYADSGSAKTFVNSSLVEKDKLLSLEQPSNFTLLDGTPLVVLGKTSLNLLIAGIDELVEVFLLIFHVRFY